MEPKRSNHFLGDSHAEDARTAQSAASGQRSETVSDQDVPTAEQKSAKQRHKTLTTLCTIFGAIFLLVGIGDLADAIELWGHEIDWGELLTALAQTIGGGQDRRRPGQHRPGRVVRGGRHRRGPRPRCGGTRHRPRLFRSRCLHRLPHRHPCRARGRTPAAQGPAAGAGSGTGRPVRLPSAAAANRKTCTPPFSSSCAAPTMPSPTR